MGGIHSGGRPCFSMCPGIRCSCQKGRRAPIEGSAACKAINSAFDRTGRAEMAAWVAVNAVISRAACCTAKGIRVPACAARSLAADGLDCLDRVSAFWLVRPGRERMVYSNTANWDTQRCSVATSLAVGGLTGCCLFRRRPSGPADIHSIFQSWPISSPRTPAS
jgi:hypothetical protein